VRRQLAAGLCAVEEACWLQRPIAYLAIVSATHHGDTPLRLSLRRQSVGNVIGSGSQIALKKATTPAPTGAASAFKDPPRREVASLLSVPARRRPGHAGSRWETIGSVLDSNARTLRLCVILLVMALSPAVGVAAAAVIQHALMMLLAR